MHIEHDAVLDDVNLRVSNERCLRNFDVEVTDVGGLVDDCDVTTATVDDRKDLAVDNLAILTHTEAVQLWHTPDCGPHTTLDRDLVCHGIRRTVSEYTYIAGLHQRSGGDEEAGLTLVAGSSCPSSSCVRLGQIRNKKVKPCSLLEGAPGLVTSSVFPRPGVLVTGAESGELSVWREAEEEEETGGKMVSSKKHKAKEKPY